MRPFNPLGQLAALIVPKRFKGERGLARMYTREAMHLTGRTDRRRLWREFAGFSAYGKLSYINHIRDTHNVNLRTTRYLQFMKRQAMGNQLRKIAEL